MVLGGVIVTANLGGFERPMASRPGLVDITDREFAPRSKSMTPRLQARIVKTHMWEFAPGYDQYIWVDSSCEAQPGAEEWILCELEGYDVVVFEHPDRQTLQQEADYLKQRLGKGCPYITPRYENELIDEQMAAVGDGPLYASTVFAIRDSEPVRAAMREWWYHISRYHSIDQLSFPYILRNLKVKVLPRKEPYFEYVRNKPKESA